MKTQPTSLSPALLGSPQLYEQPERQEAISLSEILRQKAPQTFHIRPSLRFRNPSADSVLLRRGRISKDRPLLSPAELRSAAALSPGLGALATFVQTAAAALPASPFIPQLCALLSSFPPPPGMEAKGWANPMSPHRRTAGRTTPATTTWKAQTSPHGRTTTPTEWKTPTSPLGSTTPPVGWMNLTSPEQTPGTASPLAVGPKLDEIRTRSLKSRLKAEKAAAGLSVSTYVFGDNFQSQETAPSSRPTLSDDALTAVLLAEPGLGCLSAQRRSVDDWEAYLREEPASV